MISIDELEKILNDTILRLNKELKKGEAQLEKPFTHNRSYLKWRNFLYEQKILDYSFVLNLIYSKFAVPAGIKRETNYERAFLNFKKKFRIK